MAYSADGDRLALTGPGFIRLIATGTREEVSDRPINGEVTRIAFTADETRLVAVIHRECGDTWISIRDARTLRPVGPVIRPLAFRSSGVKPFCTTPFFALTPDGRSLVTAAADGELAWWDLESRRRTRTVRIEKGYHALALSTDGRTVAVGVDRGVQFVDVPSGAVRSATGALAARPNWLLFSRDGRTVVSTSSDGTVTLWDVRSATPRQTLRGHSAAVQQPVFSPDGTVLYTVAHDGTAIAWDVSGDSGLERRFTFTHDRTPEPKDDEHPGAFSPDGQVLALGLRQRGIALWDATTVRRAGPTLPGTGGEVKDIAFASDGPTLAAVTVEGLATVWDVDRRLRLLGPFRVAQGYGRLGVSISPDGRLLATAGGDGDGDGVLLWDIHTGAALGRVGEGLTAGDVAFSPDGSSLALVRGIGGTVEIWELAGRSRTATLQPPTPI
jgi:WD40 repeat protein